MASTIFDKVKQGASVLEEAKARPAPITSLAQSQNQLVPTDQMSAQLLGANPDQTKMVGGQPQLRNAIQKNTEPGKDLATQQREAQPQRQASSPEQQQLDEQKRLANLGSLDNRVQNLVNQKLDLQNQSLQLDVDTSKLPATLSDADKAAAKDLLLKVNQGTATIEDTAQLNRLLGRNIDSTLTKDEISSYLKTGEQLAAEQAANKIQDTVTLKDLTPTELGYSTWDDLAKDLGADPTTITNYSVNQLIEAVQAKQRADYSSADRWRQVLADPTSSPNDRAEAQRILRNMGAVGVRQADDKMEKLSADIAASNTVDVGGEQYTVDQLLKDDTIAGIAKSYFENADEAAKIKASNPGLAAFFDQHSDLLADAVKHVTQEVGDLDVILTQNKQIRDQVKNYVGTDLYNKMFAPQMDQVTSSVNKVPAWMSDSRFSAADLTQVGSLLSDLYSVDPTYADKINNLGYDDIKRLGLNTQEGRQNFTTFAKIQSMLNKTDEQTDADTVVQSIFGDEAALASNLRGLKGVEGKAYGTLDSNQDGQIDTPEEIKTALRATYGQQDLLSGYTNNNPLDLAKSIQNQVAKYQDPNSIDGQLFKAFSNDGKLSYGEASAIGEKYQAAGDLNSLKTLNQRFPDQSGFADAWYGASLTNLDQTFAKIGKPSLGSIQATAQKMDANNTGNRPQLQDWISTLNSQISANKDKYSNGAIAQMTRVRDQAQDKLNQINKTEHDTNLQSLIKDGVRPSTVKSVGSMRGIGYDEYQAAYDAYWAEHGYKSSGTPVNTASQRRQ